MAIKFVYPPSDDTQKSPCDPSHLLKKLYIIIIMAWSSQHPFDKSETSASAASFFQNYTNKQENATDGNLVILGPASSDFKSILP